MASAFHRTTMSKTFETADKAYEYLREEIFPIVSSYVHLFKTPQNRQDEYIVIRPINPEDEETYTASVYSTDRDILDMLVSVGVPPHVKHLGLTEQNRPHFEKTTVLSAWRREPSTQRSRLTGLCYWPGGELVIEGKLNTYKDVSVAAVEPPDPQALDDILDHVRDNICNGSKDYADYLLKWLAHMVQFPAIRPKTAVAVIGDQGTGKGIFIDFLKQVLGGDRNCNTTASSSDTKAFNFALANKLFVVFDEATFAGDRQQSDFMKKLVTEPRIRVEPKGVDAYEVENFVRVFITSNNMTSAVPAGIGARRWLIIECRNDVDTKWLKNLAVKIGNNGPVEGCIEGYASWFKHYLQTLDLDGFDTLALPMQDTGFETKLNGLYREDPMKAFMWEWLRADDLTLYRQIKERRDGEDIEFDFPLVWEREVVFADFYAIFAEHCDKSHTQVPAANRVKAMLERYGGTTAARKGNMRYVILPEPSHCLGVLRKSSRFDNPISQKQEEVIRAAWKNEVQPRPNPVLKFFEEPVQGRAEFLVDDFPFDLSGSDA